MGQGGMNSWLATEKGATARGTEEKGGRTRKRVADADGTGTEDGFLDSGMMGCWDLNLK